MTRLLDKIAEKIVGSKDLPYRDRVEVVIVKDGKVLLTKSTDKETGKPWYGFPGGGVEDMTPEKACIAECLEEVGVRVKNVKALNINHTQEGGMSKKEDRHLKFRGSKTQWFSADFDAMDRSKLGDDGDSRKYSWYEPSEASTSLSKSKVMATPRVKAIRALKA